MKIKVDKITSDNFRNYGQLVSVNSEQSPDIDSGLVKFWAKQAVYLMEGKTEIGILQVQKHEMVFDQLENHFKSSTLLISVDGDFILPVAPCSDEIPGITDLKAFEIKQGQAVLINEKCWHGEVYPIGKEKITVLVFLAENTLANDTVFESIDQICSIVY